MNVVKLIFLTWPRILEQLGSTLKTWPHSASTGIIPGHIINQVNKQNQKQKIVYDTDFKRCLISQEKVFKGADRMLGFNTKSYFYGNMVLV